MTHAEAIETVGRMVSNVMQARIDKDTYRYSLEWQTRCRDALAVLTAPLYSAENLKHAADKVQTRYLESGSYMTEGMATKLAAEALDAVGWRDGADERALRPADCPRRD